MRLYYFLVLSVILLSYLLNSLFYFVYLPNLSRRHHYLDN